MYKDQNIHHSRPAKASRLWLASWFYSFLGWTWLNQARHNLKSIKFNHLARCKELFCLHNWSQWSVGMGVPRRPFIQELISIVVDSDIDYNMPVVPPSKVNLCLAPQRFRFPAVEFLFILFALTHHGKLTPEWGQNQARHLRGYKLRTRRKHPQV